MRVGYRDVEGILYNYKKIKAEIKNLDLEIEFIQGHYIGAKAIDTSQESGGQTNKVSSTVENEVLGKERQVRQLKKLRDRKIKQIKCIDNALDSLQAEDKKLIQLRYFERVPNYEVADLFNITEQGSSIRKRKIIKKVESIFNSF